MTRHSYFGYVFIVAVLLFLITLSTAKTERLQHLAVATLSPVREQIDRMIGWFRPADAYAAAPSLSGQAGIDGKLPDSERVRCLELDNQLLTMQLRTLQEQLVREIQLNTALANKAGIVSELDANSRNKFLDDKKRLSSHLEAVPAHVISRSPSSWNSSLWIDVGEEDNIRLGRKAISKNSPVLLGSSVVGVVEYIGQRQSRIRLITDAGLNPSVCNVRGGVHQFLLMDYIDTLIGFIEKQGDPLIRNETRKAAYLTVLKGIREVLAANAPDITNLAKGELHGSSYPLWRKRGNLLKGIGFNCDVADDIGPARDLRTGQPLNQPDAPPMALLKIGDLLVTTGMDGVFPPGLPVAEVTKVHLLKEGDYTYELEAKPTAGNLEELSSVFVIPALTQHQ